MPYLELSRMITSFIWVLSSIWPTFVRVLTRQRREARTQEVLVNLGSKRRGGARRGDIKSPVLVGGGRTFGPQPRDYSFKLNKKTKQLARKSALSYKAKDNNIIVVEDFDFEAPKTKEFINFTNNLKVSDKKSVLFLSELNKTYICQPVICLNQKC